MKTSTQKLLIAVTTTLTAARLTRLVTTDKLGKWLIQEPVDMLMGAYYEEALQEAKEHGTEPVEPWWWKYRSGLECQWCVGFWLTLGAVAVERGTRNSTPLIRKPIEVFGTALALNYLSASIETLNPANQESDLD